MLSETRLSLISDSAIPSENAALPKSKKAKGLGIIVAAILRENPARKSLSLGVQIRKEMSIYLEQPCEESTSDLLSWLKTHKTAFLPSCKNDKEVPLCTCYKCDIRAGGGNYC